MSLQLHGRAVGPVNGATRGGGGNGGPLEVGREWGPLEGGGNGGPLEVGEGMEGH